MLLTKLHKPPKTKDHIRRNDLLNYLDLNKDKPFTLVSAPAGYGKSVTISSWLDENSSLYAWVSLGKDENDIRSFVELLQMGLNKALGYKLKKLGNLVDGGELPPVSIIAEHLINDLDTVSQELILVLDDFHLINNVKILELVNILLKYPPQHINLVIITRFDPMLDLNTLKAYNRMNEIRASELSFNLDEINELFSKITDVKLEKDTINYLKERTEGWVTGLRLASFIAKDNTDKGQVLKELKGSFHLINEYLVNEVVKRQSKEVQQYLYRVSLLESFSAELIDSIITSDKDFELSGTSFIQILKDLNLFVIPLDNEGNWYRFHRLFQEILKTKTHKEVLVAELNDIYLKASNWFAKNNFIDEGIENAIKGSNLPKAVEIVEENWRSTMNNGKWFLVVKWLSKIPESYIAKSQELLLAQSWQYYYHFNVSGVLDNMNKIESMPNSKKYVAEISLFKGYSAYFMAEGEKCFKYINQSLELFEIDDVEFRSQSEILFGLSGQMCGKLDLVKSKTVKWLKEHKNLHPLRESCLLWSLAFTIYIEGDLDNAWYYASKLEKVSKKANIHNFYAWSKYLMGLIDLQRGKVDTSITYLNEAKEHRYAHFTRASVDGIATLAVLYQILGDEKMHNEMLSELKELNEFLEDIYDDFVVSTVAKIKTLAKRNSENLPWINNATFIPQLGKMSWYIQPDFVWSKSLIEIGTSEAINKAQNYLLQLKDINKSHHNNIQLISIYNLLADSFIKIGNTIEALNYIKKSTAISQQSGIIFPFSEYGNEFLSLLEKTNFKDIAALESLIDFKSKSQFKGAELKDSQRNKIHSSLKVNLSFREMEILQLVSKGFRNKEIANKLFISEGTIKKHVYNITHKLNCTNRLSCVKMAESLGLIKG